MKVRNRIIWAAAFIFAVQILYFRDYVNPFSWGQLKVAGLACTCPDVSVVGGRFYLRSITPDSLRKYNIDYSEVFVANKPASDADPMGSGDM
jgi:hypothetical protein